MTLPDLSPLLSHPGVLLTYGLLTLALIALWVPDRAQPQRRVPLWAVLFAASLVSALWAGYVTLIALPFIAGFGLATYVFARAHRRSRQLLAAVIIVALAVGFMMHGLPGFHNYKVLSGVVLSVGAIPYSQYFNYDKAVLGLFLVAFTVPVLTTPEHWSRMLRAALPWGLLLAGGLSALAVAIGYVRLDIKFPPEGLIWAWANLFFTCLPEEAFFRGFLQRNLQAAMTPSRYAGPVALTLASIVFGLSHLGGGLTFTVLATVAGFGYGWVYQRTGAIEASIGVHFLVNALHFVFFTYPALA